MVPGWTISGGTNLIGEGASGRNWTLCNSRNAVVPCILGLNKTMPVDRRAIHEILKLLGSYPLSLRLLVTWMYIQSPQLHSSKGPGYVPLKTSMSLGIPSGVKVACSILNQYYGSASLMRLMTHLANYSCVRNNEVIVSIDIILAPLLTVIRGIESSKGQATLRGIVVPGGISISRVPSI